MEAEAAPFVCYVENEPSTSQEAHLTSATEYKKNTQQAIDAGMGIIDGGATKTLSSVYALERLMEINQSKKGSTGVANVDLDEQPVFGFGNSSRDQHLNRSDGDLCQPAMLKIHALDKGQGPILISVDTLRTLGAVIDFEADLVAFRKLDENQVDPRGKIRIGTPADISERGPVQQG